MADNSNHRILTGKLLPQTEFSSCHGLIFYNVYLIRFPYHPRNSGKSIAPCCLPVCYQYWPSTGWSISVRIVYNSPLGTEHRFPMG